MRTCPVCGTVNPDGFRFCGQCGTVLHAATPERRKTATILFCDVSGSTALGERLETEAVREVMLRYFDEMRVALERHSGVVEKFIGDAVMAVFGVPVAHEDDALRAVRAAVDMLARLEETAAVGEVLLGELTWRLTRQAVHAEPVEPLALKGKEKLVPAYRLLGLSDDAPERAARAGSALVGREEELARLHRELDAAVAERGCRLVTTIGEPGMGKSRLVEEFIGSRRPGTRLLRGRGLSYGEGITYWALGEIVRTAARLDKDEPAATARTQLGALLAGTEDADAATGLLVQAIGLESGSGATGEIAWAARRLVEAAAREQPGVVAIEDLHWAEPALLDLVEQLAALAHGPILVLCTSRPGLLETRP